ELLAWWEGRSAESLALRSIQGDGRAAPEGAPAAPEGAPAAPEGVPAAPEGARAFQASDQRKTIIFVTHDLEEAISLADEVVVLSAGPAAHVVAQHEVSLDRPRDLMELRTLPAFVDMYRAIWAVLREEVIKSQRAAEAARG